MDKKRLDAAMDELLREYRSPEDITGPNGLLKQLTKSLLERAIRLMRSVCRRGTRKQLTKLLLERAMGTELTHHLGYEKHSPEGRGSGNSRNGASSKLVKGDFGEVEIAVPRDREGSFEPKILPKHERRFHGFDDKILSMYARGMSTRDIQSHLEEIYQVEVSASLISEVTDSVMEEVRAWQARPLDAVYPIVYLDALVVKMRHEGRVENRAVFVGIAINMEGHKEVLGLWTSAAEGSKFWLQILTALRNRGVKDILMACVDGLRGFPEAINAVYPKTEVQLCIVHMVRNSLQYVNWKERQKAAADLRGIYRAATVEQAEQRLTEFEEKWNGKYASIGQLWRRHWAGITPFFAYPETIRKVVYTTNAIESLNMTLRKVIKARASFPSEEAAMKLLFLALRNAAKKWKFVQAWAIALNHFNLLWGDRIEAARQRDGR